MFIYNINFDFKIKIYCIFSYNSILITIFNLFYQKFKFANLIFKPLRNKFITYGRLSKPREMAFEKFDPEKYGLDKTDD